MVRSHSLYQFRKLRFAAPSVKKVGGSCPELFEPEDWRVPLHVDMEDLRSLAKVPLFQGLDADHLRAVYEGSTCKRKGANEVVFRQGQEARWSYVLLRGRLKVAQSSPDGHQILNRYVGPEEMFGCVLLYKSHRYPATATTVSPSVVLAWDRDALFCMLERFPRVALNALELLGEELAIVRSRYLELATERVERRVARALLRLTEKSGKADGRGVEIAFPVSRQDLADLTGTTLHTVSRILSGWRQQGWIESGRRRIKVHDPSVLRSIAEDDRPLQA